MSAIPGERPLEQRRNFHGTKGEHLFPHPESYESRRSLWSGWERRYAAHLDRHKELAENPEPMDGDHEAVTKLFAHIACLESIIAKEKKLITAIRLKAARGTEADSLDLMETARILRERVIGS